jgi:hypothetical protein
MYTTNDNAVPTLPKLPQLPLELRQQIYSHLCPPTPISYPLPTVGITSLSHQPPPLSLLLTNHAISHDIQFYFYSIASWKLIASHAFNFYRIDPTLANLAASQLLTRLQKVELVFWFDGALLKSYPSLKTSTYCQEIKKRAIRACEILATAPQLRVVMVSWVDTTIEEAIEEKREVLNALRCLDGRVKLETGVLEWSGAQAGDMRGEFERKVKGYIHAVRTDEAP